MRFGIEELLDEVKHLDLQQYLALRLPLQLRYLPDLLVAEIDMSHVFLVEVKFRRRFDRSSARSLYEALRKQREYWPQSYAVIMVAEPIIAGRGYHQDHIRVLAPGETDVLVDESLAIEQRWERLHQIQRVFKRFNKFDHIVEIQECADSLTQTLRDLVKL